MADTEILQEDEGKILLTDDQKSYILLNYTKKSLIELTRYISGDPKADGRHKMGRVIREFLNEKGLEYETTKFSKEGDLVLTEEQEDFLRQNISVMKPLEAARVLFKNEKISPLHREFKAVQRFMDKITPGITKREDAPIEEEFKPPTTVYKMMHLVNKYVPNRLKENEPMYKSGDKLTAQDIKNLTAMLSYMQLPRLRLIVKNYTKQIDVDVFLSTFIGMTFDKSDLLREEMDQYISLAAEIVTTEQIGRNVNTLNDKMNDVLDSTDPEKMRISMGLVELINTSQEKWDKSKERQKKLIAELTGSRAERMKGRIEANASILNLVDAWRDEEKRKKMLELAIKQKDAEKKDIDELSNMESVVSLIAGITKNEIL